MAQWSDVRNWHLCTKRCQLKVRHFITRVLKISVSQPFMQHVTCEQCHSNIRDLRFNLFILFTKILWSVSGQSNLTNIPISPVLAGLTLAAAILFAIVCIVLATVYRRQANRFVYPPHTNFIRCYFPNFQFLPEILTELLFMLFFPPAEASKRIWNRQNTLNCRQWLPTAKSNKSNCKHAQQRHKSAVYRRRWEAIAPASATTMIRDIIKSSAIKSHQMATKPIQMSYPINTVSVSFTRYSCQSYFHRAKEDCLQCDDESDTESTIRFC